LQAKAILASVRPRDLAGKTRRRLAVEQLAELVPVEKKIKALSGELKQMVKAKGCSAATRLVRSVPWRATPRNSIAAAGGKSPTFPGVRSGPQLSRDMKPHGPRGEPPRPLAVGH